MNRAPRIANERGPNRYSQLLEHLFAAHYSDGAAEVEFDREEMEAAAEKLGIRLPRNPYDIVYTFRFRAALPVSISEKAPQGQQWILRTGGHGRYRFVAVSVEANITPDPTSQRPRSRTRHLA